MAIQDSTTIMAETIRAILAPRKGILAADESFPTIKKRFDSVKVESTEENRRAYRELLFTTPNLERYISGVILFDETVRQSTGGKTFPPYLTARGIVPGIKVDGGTVELPGLKKEKVTQGLDGLSKRLKEYYELGARFTKWRAVFTIGPGLPSHAATAANAHALARFAAASQSENLVPIVEPEVLMNGEHAIEDCERVTETTLRMVFAALVEQGVVLENMLLKCGMVLAGDKSRTPADDAAVARATLLCFRRSVPAAVPGIVFLSGGQSSDDATRRLAAICAEGKSNAPWKLSFSYGRALQDDPLHTWKGSSANVASAQQALLSRAEKNSAALSDH
ncbi:MAG TPA: class I fructose-bisphosphate aldolase [Opitutaceae bacterium]|nr:class I fructose-bisphosphate aldolase [Opitutaceae bacterium]